MFTFLSPRLRALPAVTVIVVLLTTASSSARPELLQDGMTPCERFGTTPAVFVGEVGAPTRHRIQVAPDAPPIEVSALPVTVERSFRGVAANTLVYLYPFDGTIDPASSASAPAAGGRYLIYGAFNFDPLKDVVMPLAIKQMDDAAADVAFLEASDLTSKSGSISGVLVEGNMSDASQKRTPLPGVTIRFRSPDTTAEALSDEKGHYSVFDLPEGLIKIEPVLPDHLFGNRTAVVRAGGCTPQVIVAELNGRIRGRVLHADGSPMTWMVSLLPTHTRGAGQPQARLARADKNGDYEFSVVAPGEYLLGVNVGYPPNNEAPVPATYYPGAVSRHEAVPVVVGEGTVHEGIDITLPAPLPRVKLEIRIQGITGSSSSVVCLQDITSPPSAPGRTYSSAGMPIVIDGFEGSRYRLMAHVEHPDGHLESDIVDVKVAPGHLPLHLSATLPARAHLPGDPCGAFSITR